MREKKNKIFDWVWAVTIGMGEKKEEKNIWLNGIKKKSVWMEREWENVEEMVWRVVGMEEESDHRLVFV